jgi:hypothetical protein
MTRLEKTPDLHQETNLDHGNGREVEVEIYTVIGVGTDQNPSLKMTKRPNDDVSEGRSSDVAGRKKMNGMMVQKRLLTMEKQRM